MQRDPSRSRTQTAIGERRLVAPLLRWFSRSARALPWRQTQDPYAIWVSEVMLQQTRVETVIPYWQRWMQEWPDVSSLARAAPRQVLKAWEGLGYYSRARNLHQAARRLLRHHDGRVPRRVSELLELPGIGRYTAGAVASIAFNAPEPVVDGNVARVLSRVFVLPLDPARPRGIETSWRVARLLVAEAHRLERAGSRNCSHLNQALMELGAVMCTPRSPACAACPIERHCRARQLGRVGDFPQNRPRPETRKRRFAAFVVEREGCFLVQQRPAAGINARLWEFPNVELPHRDALIAAAARGMGLELIRPGPVLCINHTITRSRIRLEVYEARPRRGVLAVLRASRFLSPRRLRQLPFPSAHHRIRHWLTHRQAPRL